MDNKATPIISQFLQQNETLIWAGQPKKGIVFEVVDIFKTILVSLFLVLIYFAIDLLSDISILLAVPIGIIFFSAALILGVGRFFIDAELRKNTYYGLTDKRIIIVSKMYPKKVQSVYLDSKPKIEFLPTLGDTSTIDIGLNEPTGKRGMVSWFPNFKGYTYLYRLEEGNFVHKKIKELIR